MIKEYTLTELEGCYFIYKVDECGEYWKDAICACKKTKTKGRTKMYNYGYNSSMAPAYEFGYCGEWQSNQKIPAVIINKEDNPEYWL